MQDIKRKPKTKPTPAKNQPDLEFLAPEKHEAKVSLNRLRHRFGIKSVIILGAIALVVLVLLLNIGQSEKKRLPVPATPKENYTAVNDEPITEAIAFRDDKYYKVELIDSAPFYARVVEVSAEHYLLRSIFFVESEGESSFVPTDVGTSEDDQHDNITLVKYDTQSDQPADELLLPRERVKYLSPLRESSPIVEAIENYLSQN